MNKKHNVIALHGWGSSPNKWQWLNLLGDKYQIYVPFLPGFDKDHPINKPFKISDYAIWLDDFIKTHKIVSPTLIGHSNGGRIALYYCANFVNDVKKIILINSAGIPPKNTLKRSLIRSLAKLGGFVFKLIKNDKMSKFAKKIIYKLAGSYDYLNASPVMKKTLQNVIDYDVSADLNKVNCDSLCIWGEQDHDTPLWMGKIIANKLHSKKLIILNAGHNPHVTHSQELLEIIANYLNK